MNKNLDLRIQRTYRCLMNAMLEHYMDEAEEKTDDSRPYAYYVAFFDAFMQFIEKNYRMFGPPTRKRPGTKS